MANTWQGAFPRRNTGAARSGWALPPVGTFPANGDGLFDLASETSGSWTTELPR